MAGAAALPLLTLAGALLGRAWGNTTEVTHVLDVCKTHSPFYTQIEEATVWYNGECRQIDCYVALADSRPGQPSVYPLSTQGCNDLRWLDSTSGSPYYKASAGGCLEGGVPNLTEYSDADCSQPTGRFILGGGSGDECAPWWVSTDFVRLTVNRISIKNPTYAYLTPEQMTEDYPQFRLHCGPPRASGALTPAASGALLLACLAAALAPR